MESMGDSGSQYTEEAHSDLWTHQLPPDILCLILQRLRAVDHVRLGAVCTSLRAAIARAEVRPLLQFPLVEFPLVFYAAFRYLENDHMFSSLAMDEFFTINPDCTRRRKITGAVGGHWLIMFEYREYLQYTRFFLNLTTGEQIMLPSIQFDKIFFVQKFVVSSEPTDPDCLVVGLLMQGWLEYDNHCMIFCRIRDRWWMPMYQRDTIKDLEFTNIIFFDGKLYALTNEFLQFLVVFTFDLDADDIVRTTVQKLVIGPPWSIPSSSAFTVEGLAVHLRAHKISLAADPVSRELMLIVTDTKIESIRSSTYRDPRVSEALSSYMRNPSRSETIGFRLFKMDMDGPSLMWKEIADIGHRVLFIGNFQSFLVPVESLVERIQGNSIYYCFCSCAGFSTGGRRVSLTDIGRFNLNDSTILRYHRPKSLSSVKLAGFHVLNYSSYDNAFLAFVSNSVIAMATGVPNLYNNMEKTPALVFFKGASNVFTKDELGTEILKIALPAALALTADPIASLIDTAFIGHIGPVELAAVGVAIAIFNQASKIAIFPLVSVTTSLVAEEAATEKLSFESVGNDTITNEVPAGGETQIDIGQLQEQDDLPLLPTRRESNNASAEHRRHIPSASSAMLIGSALGLIQAIFLILAANPILKYIGVDSHSPMLKPAQRYLTLRALGAPAVLLSLAMQGVYRGIKDTKTPLYATVIGDVANIILDPIFMFSLRLGVSGAAIAHVISQYLIALILLWRLMEQVDLLPPSIRDLKFERLLKNGFLLLVRVIAVTFCVTLAASLAARQGSTSMAAFQVCLQIWLATALVADGLAVSGQAILASAFARKDYNKAIRSASRVVQLGLILGILLSLTIFGTLQFGSRLFTDDANVLQLITLAAPFVAVTQPLNALAFVFDGLNYGASDFAYAACSMVTVSMVSIICLYLLSSSYGFIGIWMALSIYMSLRTFAGFWRIGTGTGPWSFIRE